MGISILDNSLSVQVYFDKTDAEFEDNVCLCFEETCIDDEKIFRAEKTHIYLTVKEARELAQSLIDAVDASQEKL